MQMLVDPVLTTWVPSWVVEQYERANPFFQHVLRKLQHARLRGNRDLLLRLKKEMIRRHQKDLRGAKEGKENKGVSDEDDSDSGTDEESGQAESETNADAVAADLLEQDEEKDDSIATKQKEAKTKSIRIAIRE